MHGAFVRKCRNKFLLTGCDSIVLPLNLIDILKSEKQTNRVLEITFCARSEKRLVSGIIHSKNFKKSFLFLF